MGTENAIFLLDGQTLTAMHETEYATEEILQKALADYPNLIAGVATAGDNGRLLLVRREMPVPGAAGGGQLSLDHLFIDNRGIPVLVEVKRSSDTRARREVVAQMLDYAANGVAYWPPEQLRASVLQEATRFSLDESTLLQQRLGVEDEPDAFWRVVEDNLRSGRVRLIFLADRLTAGLVRIIEFLNEQMRDTEVLGIELPQYTGSGQAVVYVPSVIGKTATAVDVKRGTGSGTQWTRDTLIAAAQQVCTDTELQLITALLDHRESRTGHFSWGKGAAPGVTGWYLIGGVETPVWNFNIGTASGKGTFYFIFGEYASRHPSARVAAYGAAVAGVAPAHDKVAAAEANGWKGWVSLPLQEAASHQQAVLAAVDAAQASD